MLDEAKRVIVADFINTLRILDEVGLPLPRVRNAIYRIERLQHRESLYSPTYMWATGYPNHTSA